MNIIAACMAAVRGRGFRVVLPEGEDERILGAAVEIAPSTHLGQPRGPVIKASARILSVHEQQMAEQAMNTKYGWQKQFFALIWRLQGQEHIYIEITPTCGYGEAHVVGAQGPR